MTCVFMGSLVFVVAILSAAMFSLASIVRSKWDILESWCPSMCWIEKNWEQVEIIFEVLHFLFLCEYRGGGNLFRVVSLIC